ncbi:MAG: nucleotidyltransferase family protein [Parasphingorhabdus sp.]
MMKDAMTLVRTLCEPQSTLNLDGTGWSELISIARAESLVGTLARQLNGIDIPADAQSVLDDEIDAHDLVRQRALWEAECARRALSGYDGKVLLMKGTAYVASGLSAGIGRNIGDLDIMVSRKDLKSVEDMLLTAGWEWVKPDPYDDQYYREHMHELPPLIHRERDTMIDVHHTTLPLTANPTPDAQAMLDDAVMLENGLFIMSPVDMLCHCAAHLMADGDLAGGLRNLWDMHCLLTEFSSDDPGIWEKLGKRAEHHQLGQAVTRSVWHAHDLYGTDIPPFWQRGESGKGAIRHRLLARDGYGRETRKLTRQAFYIRSHWLRMPPLMLTKHLWTKWRKGGAGPS